MVIFPIPYGSLLKRMGLLIHRLHLRDTNPSSALAKHSIVRGDRLFPATPPGHALHAVSDRHPEYVVVLLDE